MTFNIVPSGCRRVSLLIAVLAAVALAACAEEDDANGGAPDGELNVPTTYEFDSRFTEGSSVAYSGQILRHVLIDDLKTFIGGLTTSIDAGELQPAVENDLIDAFDFWFRFDSDANGGEAILLTTSPPTDQQTYDDISTGKDIVGKLAGNDSPDRLSADFSTELRGWSDQTIAEHGGSTSSAEGLVLAFFETLEANGIARAEGESRTGPSGEELPVHLTASGLDLQQLVQKFLLMAVAFHQGTDDYLDEGIAGTDNTQRDDDPYTGMEHGWDEGFGYFGAARDYLAYTDEEIAGKGGRDGWSDGYYDSDGDGAIDLVSEYNFGASTNAAKRDLGASDSAPTDFTNEAMMAFLTGRAILAQAGDTLTTEQQAALFAQRDIAVLAWEKAIAATAVHYINDTLQDMNDFGTDSYGFADHAKHWSELKGFALGLQFNPRSPLTAAQFDEFHGLIGDAPVLADADVAEIDAYRQSLIDARSILGTAYGFDDANLGDDQGENGW